MVRWREHPACLLNLHPNEIFFFFLIKGMYFPSLSTEKKIWVLPWVNFLLGKQITEGGLRFKKRYCKSFQKDLPYWGRKLKCKMWNFEVKESIICLLSVLAEASVTSQSVFGNSSLVCETEVLNTTWDGW